MGELKTHVQNAVEFRHAHAHYVEFMFVYRLRRFTVY